MDDLIPATARVALILDAQILWDLGDPMTPLPWEPDLILGVAEIPLAGLIRAIHLSPKVLADAGQRLRAAPVPFVLLPTLPPPDHRMLFLTSMARDAERFRMVGGQAAVIDEDQLASSVSTAAVIKRIEAQLSFM